MYNYEKTMSLITTTKKDLIKRQELSTACDKAALSAPAQKTSMQESTSGGLRGSKK